MTEGEHREVAGQRLTATQTSELVLFLQSIAVPSRNVRRPACYRFNTARRNVMAHRPAAFVQSPTQPSRAYGRCAQGWLRSSVLDQDVSPSARQNIDADVAVAEPGGLGLEPAQLINVTSDSYLFRLLPCREPRSSRMVGSQCYLPEIPRQELVAHPRGARAFRHARSL